MVAADIFRGRYRASLEKPWIAADKALPTALRCRPRITCFCPGTGSWCRCNRAGSAHDRNPQTFVPIFWAKPGYYRKVMQRIYHAPGKCSLVELPIVINNQRGSSRRHEDREVHGYGHRFFVIFVTLAGFVMKRCAAERGTGRLRRTVSVERRGPDSGFSSPVIACRHEIFLDLPRAGLIFALFAPPCSRWRAGGSSQDAIRYTISAFPRRTRTTSKSRPPSPRPDSRSLILMMAVWTPGL